jgi:hypothetical protein
VGSRAGLGGRYLSWSASIPPRVTAAPSPFAEDSGELPADVRIAYMPVRYDGTASTFAGIRDVPVAGGQARRPALT